MTFQQAVQSMLEGNRVSTGGVTYEIQDGLICDVEDGESIDLSPEFVASTFTLVKQQADTLWAVFNTEKGRWVSTTEPDKHRALGKRVGVFKLDQVG